MIHIQMFFSEMGALFVNLFEHPDWRNLVDISILTVIVYHILRLVIRTRARTRCSRASCSSSVLSWASKVLQISALNWLLQQVLSLGFILIVIVFQPELRRALDQIGRSKWTGQMFSSSSKMHAEGQTEKHVSELVGAP